MVLNSSLQLPEKMTKRQKYETLVEKVTSAFRLTNSFYDHQNVLRLMRAQAELQAFTATLSQEEFEDFQLRIEQTM